MTGPASGKGRSSLPDIRSIMRLLPHRYPFLLVDRVLSIEDNTIRAYKCVSINEPFFQGHFPDLPVMPGVLILEAMAQSGGILVLSGMEDTAWDSFLCLFTSMEGVRFRRQVLPGDRLDLTCELVRQKLQLWKIRGAAHVDGALAAEAVLTAALVPRQGESR
ncbi:MAG: 3-hydroxyacyl-ACP dehydratase FabZ [Desulfovibrio sp.]|jgi:3-hydroxyacyl-[acyl-carrier-protein] dehydratase|nr:3-hydroxyacyl-ACP dehydratase FabZ [Desulfovibrio sp.]